MYQALIFDFDYTLGDTTMSIAASINYALGRLGYPPSPVEAIRKTIGLSLDLTFRALTGDRDEEKERLFFDYFQIKADEVMTKDARLYHGVEELLRKWSERFALGIVSTKHRFRIVDILKKFDLESVIRGVVGNEDVVREKPDPEGLEKLIYSLGARKETALYVGDSLVDAETAMRAGVDFAAVTTGTTEEKSFENYPHVCICGDLSEIEEILR